MTLLMYTKLNMKKCIDKKVSKHINLEDNMENFLFSKREDLDNEKLNFFQRFSNYLNQQHPDQDKYKETKMRQFTEKQLKSSHYKNLAIAFTSIDEWEKSKVDDKMREFFERVKIDKFEDDESIKCLFIIIVFKSEYKMRRRKDPRTKLYDMNDFQDVTTLNWVKEQIETKNYPISIIEISDYNDSLNQAIEFIKNLLKTSMHTPMKLSFQTILK